MIRAYRWCKFNLTHISVEPCYHFFPTQTLNLELPCLLRNFHHQILVFPVDPPHNNLTKKNRKLFLFPTYGMVNCETSLHFPNPECVCMKSLLYISTFTMTSIFISIWNWFCWLCWQKLAMGQAKNQYHNYKEGQ